MFGVSAFYLECYRIPTQLSICACLFLPFSYQKSNLTDLKRSMFLMFFILICVDLSNMICERHTFYRALTSIFDTFVLLQDQYL